MAHFTIEFSDKGDSDWAVHENGKPVAWFMGTNACERFIAERQAEIARHARWLKGEQISAHELGNPAIFGLAR